MTKADLLALVDSETGFVRTREDRYIEVDSFKTLFEGARLTYESLKNHPMYSDETGWKAIIDGWKERGLID